jgi:putative ABC transport system ATP-binding protein
MHAIELENAVKTYQIGEVKTHALDGVSLSIAEGEFTALVGTSGSGKTTMLQLMGCLDRPNSGAVKISGQDVANLSKNKRADLCRERIRDVILGLLQNMSEELPFLLIGMHPVDDPVVCLEEILAVNQHAINLLFGAKPDTVQLFNLDGLKLWFEQR